MLDHLGLQARDVEASLGFYLRTFAAIGMREAVRFKQGLTALRTLGCEVLLEVGPRPVLIQLARQAAGCVEAFGVQLDHRLTHEFLRHTLTVVVVLRCRTGRAH